MPVTVHTGYLSHVIATGSNDVEAVREQESDLAALLVELGFGSHREPEVLGPTSSRARRTRFPCRWLQRLRRLAAHASAGSTPAFDDDVAPDDDPVLDDAYLALESHLICHSDCEGHYVPFPLGEVVYLPGVDALPGGALGSSPELLAELESLAPVLGIELDEGVLDDAEAERLNAIDSDESLAAERIVWLALYEAARVSIEQNTLVTFVEAFDPTTSERPSSSGVAEAS